MHPWERVSEIQSIKGTSFMLWDVCTAPILLIGVNCKPETPSCPLISKVLTQYMYGYRMYVSDFQPTVTLSRINNLPAIAPAIQRELMVELWSLSVPCWSAHEFVWTMVAESACMPLRNHSSMELSQPSEAFTSFYNQNLQSLRPSSHRLIL